MEGRFWSAPASGGADGINDLTVVRSAIGLRGDGIALGPFPFQPIPRGIRNGFDALCDSICCGKADGEKSVLAMTDEGMLSGAMADAMTGETEKVRQALVDEALRMAEEDVAINRRIGRNGQILIPDGARILTHCNAGALATAGYGTALGVIRAARDAGKTIQVFADETRPVLQGARLTAWELQQENIPVTLITDNMAGFLMKQGLVDCVLVGADRIAANGDTANKIGTYSLAVLADAHSIPFYVAAPLSTIDRQLSSGADIPIEERPDEEVLAIRGVRIAPVGVGVYNPAFDVTPGGYIEAIISEAGVARFPYESSLEKLFLEPS